MRKIENRKFFLSNEEQSRTRTSTPLHLKNPYKMYGNVPVVSDIVDTSDQTTSVIPPGMRDGKISHVTRLHRIGRKWWDREEQEECVS